MSATRALRDRALTSATPLQNPTAQSDSDTIGVGDTSAGETVTPYLPTGAGVPARPLVSNALDGSTPLLLPAELERITITELEQFLIGDTEAVALADAGELPGVGDLEGIGLGDGGELLAPYASTSGYLRTQVGRSRIGDGEKIGGLGYTLVPFGELVGMLTGEGWGDDEHITLTDAGELVIVLDADTVGLTDAGELPGVSDTDTIGVGDGGEALAASDTDTIGVADAGELAAILDGDTVTITDAGETLAVLSTDAIGVTDGGEALVVIDGEAITINDLGRRIVHNRGPMQTAGQAVTTEARPGVIHTAPVIPPAPDPPTPPAPDPPSTSTTLAVFQVAGGGLYGSSWSPYTPGGWTMTSEVRGGVVTDVLTIPPVLQGQALPLTVAYPGWPNPWTGPPLPPLVIESAGAIVGWPDNPYRLPYLTIAGRDVTLRNNLWLIGSKPTTSGWAQVIAGDGHHEGQALLCITSSPRSFVEHVKLQNAWGDGFRVDGVSNCTFQGNTVSQAGRHGCTIITGTYVSVIANHLDECHQWGIGIEPNGPVDSTTLSNLTLAFNGIAANVGWIYGLDRTVPPYSSIVGGNYDDPWI